jgi:hypothetical protein
MNFPRCSLAKACAARAVAYIRKLFELGRDQGRVSNKQERDIPKLGEAESGDILYRAQREVQ